MVKLITILLLFLSLPIFAERDSVKTDESIQLVKYYFVLLKHGPNRTETDTTKLIKIQEGHMAHINNMANKGLLMVAGPFGDEQGGGIFILKVNSLEEAENLCNQDPAIISGRLKAEIRPWYTIKGTFSAENKNYGEKE
ncbi:MAG TPA: YciI family protein [Melioribacteraceae bacterium]|nr:YciI family protein [Melioribacteraceae bacterium]